MEPGGADADSMEQSTMNQVFTLFGKGVSQLLQQVVNQQTVVDELRGQNRSLQVQVANLTASLDEVEDRIFVRLQNMQPTIYTREGIPVDDALDTLVGKVQAANERLISNTETVSKVEAELSAKVDRDEFLAATADAVRAGESFADVSNGLQALQREIARVRQDAEDAQDRALQTIRLQVEAQMLRAQLGSDDQDLSEFVTRDELRDALARLRVGAPGAGADGDDEDASAVVEYVLAGGEADEARVQAAFEMLQDKKAQIDAGYAAENARIEREIGRLLRISGEADDDVEEEEDEPADEPAYRDAGTEAGEKGVYE